MVPCETSLIPGAVTAVVAATCIKGEEAGEVVRSTVEKVVTEGATSRVPAPVELTIPRGASDTPAETEGDSGEVGIPVPAQLPASTTPRSESSFWMARRWFSRSVTEL